MNTEKVTRRKHELAAAIVGRMTVEHAADLSDAEIERTLASCVCGPKLIRLAPRSCGTKDCSLADVTRSRCRK